MKIRQIDRRLTIYR